MTDKLWKQLEKEFKGIMWIYFKGNKKESMDGKEYFKYLKENYEQKEKAKR